jgi:hypothetical protein
MQRSAALMAALTLAAAACGTSATPTPTIAPATPTQPPAAPTPAPVTPAPWPAARVIGATVTFDGTTCTYAGPTVVPVGSAIEWTLVNTPSALQASIGASLLVSAVAFGTTWDDVAAWFAEPGSQVDAPPFLRNDFQLWSPEDAAAGVPMRTLVEPYPELVLCINEAGDDLQVYPAVLIQVMKG